MIMTNESCYAYTPYALRRRYAFVGFQAFGTRPRLLEINQRQT